MDVLSTPEPEDVFVILSMLNLVVSLAPSLVLLLTVGYAAVRHQRLFLTLFMVLTVAASTRDFAPNLAVTSSGVTVYPDDIILVVASVAAVVRIGHWRLRWINRIPVIVLALLTGLGTVAWIFTYGLQVGTNSWRPQMLGVALLMYTTTRPRRWTWNDLRIIVVAPALLASIAALFGILFHGLGSSASMLEVGGVLEDSRPLVASGSLLLLTGIWVTALVPERWDGRRLLIGAALGSMTLLTQNRSVWVAAVLGGTAWWLVPRIGPRGASGVLSGYARTALVVFVGTTIALVGLSLAEVSQSASNDGTWLWRVSRWAASMGIPRSSLEWIAGSAIGPTPASTPALFLTSAHSVYVNAIEMTGFLGLIAVLSLTLAVGRAHMPPSTEPLGLVICISFLSYGVAYQLPEWAWMVIGILLASTHGALAREDPAASCTETSRQHTAEQGHPTRPVKIWLPS